MKELSFEDFKVLIQSSSDRYTSESLKMVINGCRNDLGTKIERKGSSKNLQKGLINGDSSNSFFFLEERKIIFTTKFGCKLWIKPMWLHNYRTLIVMLKSLNWL